MGIKHVICCINKMDERLVEYDEKRFIEIKNELERFLKSVGIKNVVTIPISSLKFENIAEKQNKMPWYQGPTLFEALDAIQTPASRQTAAKKPLRIPISGCVKIGGVGTVAVGRVQTGILKPGTSVVIAPYGICTEVKSVEMHHEALAEAGPGDRVGFCLRGISCREISRGCVASDLTEPAVDTEWFRAQIVVLGHPGVIKKGYTPVLHIHTAHIACVFSEIEARLDRATNEVIEEFPSSIKAGDAAIVKLTPIKPLVVETFADFPALGRLVVRDSRQTVAVGVVKEVMRRVIPRGTRD